MKRLPGVTHCLQPAIGYLWPVVGASSLSHAVSGDLKRFEKLVYEPRRLANRCGICTGGRASCLETGKLTLLKGLILAQNERWRRGLGMQVGRIPGGISRRKWRKGQ